MKISFNIHNDIVSSVSEWDELTTPTMGLIKDGLWYYYGFDNIGFTYYVDTDKIELTINGDQNLDGYIKTAIVIRRNQLINTIFK